MFGRSTVPSVFELSRLTSAVNGCPLWSVMMPDTCQPPATAETTRLPLRNCLPFPNGSSYTGLNTRRCRISKPDSPRSRVKLLRSAALERDGVTLYGVPGVLSMDLPYMYDVRNDRPPR